MRRSRPRPPSSTIPTGQAWDNNINNGDDSVEDGPKDGSYGVNDADEAGSDWVEDGLDLDCC